MKKIFLIVLAFFLILPNFADAQSAWVIESFQSSIAINTDGTVKIEEEIAVDFKDLDKHGIYRNIPYVYESDSGEKTYTDINVDSISQDGQKAEFVVNKNDNNVSIRIGDADRTISGRHTYSIVYTAKGVLRSFENHDELYWDVTGNEWEADILVATATITVPKDKIEKVTCFEGYTGYTQECNARFDTQLAAFNSQKVLSTGEGLTVVVGYTKGMVPILTVDRPRTIFDELTTVPTVVTFIITTFLGVGSVLWLWVRHGRDHWLSTPGMEGSTARIKPLGAHETIVVEFGPPDNLRPAELGVLLDEKADTKDVTATIIDLASRGYLKIVEEPKKWLFGSVDYVLEKQKKESIDLLAYEKLLYDRLFSGKESVKLSSLKTTFYDDLADVKKSLYKGVVDKKMFVGNPESIRGNYIGFGIAAIVIGSVLMGFAVNAIFGPLPAFGIGLDLTGIFLLIFSNFVPRRTAHGRDVYRRAKGYYLFINGAEKYRQQFFEKKNMFNEILPYAIMFGLTEEFAEAMETMGMKQQSPSWYVGTRPFSYTHFSSNVASFSNSMSTAIASTPSKSGGFSGGGSSGGGFGGGGGGSW